MILLLGKTWVSRRWLAGCGCWEGQGCDLGGRAGKRGAVGGCRGGQQPHCASFLAFLGRAAGWWGRGSRGRAAGMQTPVRGEKKGCCVCRGEAKPGPGACRSRRLSHPSLHRGIWGSLGMEVAVVLGIGVVLCGVMLSPVLWGRNDALTPLGQELGFPRKGFVAWGRIFPLLLEPGACLSQT